MNELKGKTVVIEFLDGSKERIGILISINEESLSLDTGKDGHEYIFLKGIKLVRPFEVKR